MDNSINKTTLTSIQELENSVTEMDTEKLLSRTHPGHETVAGAEIGKNHALSKGSGEAGGATVVSSQLARDESLEKNLTPLLDILEARRIKSLSQYNLRLKLSMALGTIIAGLTLSYGGIDGVYTMQTVVGSFILLGIWTFQPMFSYSKTYKTEVMPQVLKFFGDFDFRTDSRIQAKRLERSGIFDKHLHYHAEDYFFGRQGDVVLEFSEAILSDSSKKFQTTDKRIKGMPMFDGMFILLEFSSEFKGRTFITSKRGTMEEKQRDTGMQLERLTLSDSKLGGMFDVYTSDKAETIQVVSMDMLRKMASIVTLFNNSPIEISIYDKFAFFKIPCSTNLFEPASITQPAFSIGDLPLLQNLLRLSGEIAEGIKNNAQMGT